MNPGEYKRRKEDDHHSGPGPCVKMRILSSSKNKPSSIRFRKSHCLSLDGEYEKQSDCLLTRIPAGAVPF